MSWTGVERAVPVGVRGQGRGAVRCVATEDGVRRGFLPPGSCPSPRPSGLDWT